MITERQWLKIIHSYINHQIDPQPSIDLDALSSLNIEDLDAITPDMFEVHEYTEEEVKEMLEALSAIIIKMEENE